MDDNTTASAAQYRDQADHWRRLAAVATTARARAHLLDKARLCEALADGTAIVALPPTQKRTV